MRIIIYRLKQIRRNWYKLPDLINSCGKKRYPNRGSLVLYVQMIWSYLFEACLFVEYFWYHWAGMTRKEHKAFVYAIERERLLFSINPSNKRTILTNKWETYNYLKPYYKRKVWFNGEGIIEDVFSKPRTILGDVYLVFKPLDKNCGRGIRLEKISSVDDLKRIGDEYKGNYLVEELVIQHPSIGELHPQSVNTLRINTCLFSDNSVYVFAPVLRIGCGKAIIDNAGAGGIIAALDKDTGVVIACGDEKCNSYKIHPDTNIALIGFKVPRYEEAIKLAKEMALKIPDLKLIGWDLALTDKGWVLIEANGNPNFLWQIATKTGIRDDFEVIKKQV